MKDHPPVSLTEYQDRCASRPATPSIHGFGIDAEGRCGHWGSRLDVVALRLPCCGEWYGCRECHDAVADHVAELWPPERLGEAVAMCGVCRRTMSGHEYLAIDDACPGCGHAFNPGCRKHRHLYFV